MRIGTLWRRGTTSRAITVGLLAMLAIMTLAPLGWGENTGKVKIGFLVKQPEEPWFQDEWKFAEQAAAKYGFELIKIGAVDGEKVLTAIDNLAARGAKGFVICTPDVRLGPAIVTKAKASDMKVLSVDDQFVGSDGKFMDVPHMGISARKIGNMVGQTIADEMKKRGWKMEDTGACVITFEELDTARERTDGATETLVAAGFPQDRIFKAPQKTTDVPGAFDAANILLTRHAQIKNWVACGLNDEAVLGAVRATEGRQLPVANIIGVGIGGRTGMVDFQKEKPTGFFASVLISPKRHGFETAEMMFKWLTEGVEPPKVTFTTGILITRENYKDVMKEQGLTE